MSLLPRFVPVLTGRCRIGLVRPVVHGSSRDVSERTRRLADGLARVTRRSSMSSDDRVRSE
jgi:hypothetical protein